jgi:chorismate mutase/prephenate dehydrogenase
MSDKIRFGLNNDSKAKLHVMREKIDAIDTEIVNLLSRRQKVIEDVVAYKKAHHLPVYHPAREEDLISLRRQQAEKALLDPDFIEELFRCIVRQSRIKQTAHLARKGVFPNGTVLIVGGRGEMGRYFERWFCDAGYAVRIMDKEDWSQVDVLCQGIDLALLSVPIDITAEIAERLGPLLPQDAVFADITSTKVTPMKAMMASHQGPVTGLHPLFGPTTSTLDKQIVVVTHGRHPEACQWVVDQFAAWGAVIVESKADEHDRIMAIVQTLRHFATFAFGQFLSFKGVDLERTLEFSSPIYRLELGMVGRLFAQDPSLYSEIIFASPERHQLLKEYIQCVTTNLEMIEKADKDHFIKEFKRIAEWFGPFSEQAIRESTFLIDKLIERF